MVRFPHIVVLAGPTAVGKSRRAMELAEEFGGDIVTADSRQVYRYMDIGTAKPTRVEQARVRHTMIDLVEPDDRYSAQRFREEGLRVLRGLAVAGRIAIVAGGTGFYLRALIDRPSLPPVSPNEDLRAQLWHTAETHGPEVLHARLAEIDINSAARIHARNTPRLIRALEIVEALGGPVPSDSTDDPLPALWLGLTTDRSSLDAVADERILRQVEAGLVDETRTLLAMGYSADSAALSGLGYREMVSVVEGRSTLDTAIAEYQSATRRFIRRQYTWFNANKRIEWFDPSTDRLRIQEKIRDYLSAQSVT